MDTCSIFVSVAVVNTQGVGQGRGGSVYLAYNSRSEFTVVRKSRKNVNMLITLRPGTQREGRHMYSACLTAPTQSRVCCLGNDAPPPQ